MNKKDLRKSMCHLYAKLEYVSGAVELIDEVAEMIEAEIEDEDTDISSHHSTPLHQKKLMEVLMLRQYFQMVLVEETQALEHGERLPPKMLKEMSFLPQVESKF